MAIQVIMMHMVAAEGMKTLVIIMFSRTLRIKIGRELDIPGIFWIKTCVEGCPDIFCLGYECRSRAKQVVIEVYIEIIGV